jgi:hypothetical protein
VDHLSTVVSSPPQEVVEARNESFGLFFCVRAIAADPLESCAQPHGYPYAMIRVMVESSPHHSSQFRGWNE